MASNERNLQDNDAALSLCALGRQSLHLSSKLAFDQHSSIDASLPRADTVTTADAVAPSIPPILPNHSFVPTTAPDHANSHFCVTENPVIVRPVNLPRVRELGTAAATRKVSSALPRRNVPAATAPIFAAIPSSTFGPQFVSEDRPKYSPNPMMFPNITKQLTIHDPMKIIPKNAQIVTNPETSAPRTRKNNMKPKDPKRDTSVPFDEMKRLMRVYGPITCVRNRTPKSTGKVAKLESIRRKFYRWFPDFDERFEKTPDGWFKPRYGHAAEMQYREQMRSKDQDVLTHKRKSKRCNVKIEDLRKKSVH